MILKLKGKLAVKILLFFFLGGGGQYEGYSANLCPVLIFMSRIGICGFWYTILMLLYDRRSFSTSLHITCSFVNKGLSLALGVSVVGNADHELRRSYTVAPRFTHGFFHSLVFDAHLSTATAAMHG